MRLGLKIAVAALLVLVLFTTGCYTGRALLGGAAILVKRKPIEHLLADPATEATLRGRLEAVLAMRAFASRELALPDNRSYRSYVELDRPYAVWNVVAAPELAVEPLTWCFPIAGCVSYRGYFSEARARRFADRNRRKGFDVDVGGVIAYSTLGWFADPVLSTFATLPEPELAGLLFHELSHQRVYIPGDTTLSESFATVVEEEGVRRWLLGRAEDELLAEFQATQEREREFLELALAHRDRLAELYASDSPAAWKRQRKLELLDGLRAEYRLRRDGWGGWNRYDRFFDDGLNNARLASLGAYYDWVPALRKVLERSGGDLETFYIEVERLAGVGEEERQRLLLAAGA